MADLLLEIDALDVTFATAGGPLHAVRSASLSVRRGETLALVGESGSGKSTLARALTRQNQPPFTRNRTTIGGNAFLSGENGRQNLVTASPAELRRLRARQVAMISQDALSGLNPVLNIGFQVAEALHAASPELSRTALRAEVTRLLEEVGLPDPAGMATRFPHQLSGGQCQRVMIAMAVARRPSLLIADEPTTALDVTVQARILRLLKAQQEKSGAAILFITHDLGVVARIADRVAVMYAGEIVEIVSIRDFLQTPRHPYTAGLLASVPGTASSHPRLVGYAPEPRALPAGCAFRPRCPLAGVDCLSHPPLTQQADRALRCWRNAA